MEALNAFLFEHRGHPLVFDENCSSELAEWDEIETPNDKPPMDNLSHA